MFKAFCLSLIGLSSLLSVHPMNKAGETDLQNSFPFWFGSRFSKEFSFEKEGNEYQLFSANKNGVTLGYVVLNGKEISLVYRGHEIPTKEEMIGMPLVTEGERSISVRKTPRLQSNSPSFSSYTYITIPSSLVLTETYSQSSSSILQNIPEYYNEAVDNGCAPTSGAMLISFYDRYSSYQALYPGLLPLNHDDNKPAVDSFIVTMSNYMNTTENGTLRSDEQIGLQQYLNDHGCGGFVVETGYSYSDYVSYYSYSNNPVFVSISGHAILGIGHASIRQYYSDGSQGIRDFMVTHYDWRSRPGSYYVPEDELEQFFYIRHS